MCPCATALPTLVWNETCPSWDGMSHPEMGSKSFDGLDPIPGWAHPGIRTPSQDGGHPRMAWSPAGCGPISGWVYLKMCQPILPGWPPTHPSMGPNPSQDGPTHPRMASHPRMDRTHQMFYCPQDGLPHPKMTPSQDRVPHPRMGVFRSRRYPSACCLLCRL